MIDAIEVLVRQKNEWRDRAETAERERDEARREREEAARIVGERTIEVMRLRHRAERAERVVEAAKVFRAVYEADADMPNEVAYLLDELFRALDAAQGDG